MRGGSACSNVLALFDRLRREEIPCCHWKSNNRLEEALAGEGDLDLLVPEASFQRFHEVIRSLAFRPGRPHPWTRQPGIRHYYGLDEASGRIVHLHVYTRLVTAGGLVKDHHLPLEAVVFDHARWMREVRIPSPGTELLLLVVRKITEHGSVSELPFLARERRTIQAELAWLRSPAAEREAEELLRRHLPVFPVELFREALGALAAWAPLPRRFLLGRRARRVLRPHRIAWMTLPSVRLFRIAWSRLVLRRKIRGLLDPGRVVAFVGADGSGKTTLLDRSVDWLSEYFEVRRGHAGKPPSSWISFLPNLFLPAARWAAPGQRLTVGTAPIPSLFTCLRALLVAYDRRRLVRRMRRHADRGAIVLCDRYPCTAVGAMDGPRIEREGLGLLKRWLGRVERGLYAGMPLADVVIRVHVPVEVAVRRAASRDGVDPVAHEAFIRRRHEQMKLWNRPGLHVDNQGTLEDAMEQVKFGLLMLWGKVPAPRIALVGNDDFSIWHFRRGLIRSLQERGAQVTVITPPGDYTDRIRSLGARHIEIPFSRFLSPVRDLTNFVRLLRIFARHRFDIVHTMTIKPNLFGPPAARLAGVPHVVGLVPGLGYSFGADGGLKMQLIRAAAPVLYRWANGFTDRMWFQNPDDLRIFVRGGLLPPSKAVLIRSSGINLDEFKPRVGAGAAREFEALGSGPLVTMAVARVVWSKGVREFVEAARALRAAGVRARFLLVGPIDPGSPDAVPERWLRQDESVHWVGFRRDIRDVLSASDVVVLPSYYREGVPRVLLEAMALEKPIVTTDSVGCREVIENGRNGIQIPVRNTGALVDAMRRMIEDPKLRATCGRFGRIKAERDFSEATVVRRVEEELYRLG